MASFFETDFIANYTFESVQDLGTGKVSDNTSSKFEIVQGTGNNQANTIFRDKLELRTGNSWTIAYDLTALTDFYGVVKNFSKIKFIYIKNTSDDTSETAQIAVLEDAANDFKGSLGSIAGSEIIILPNDTYQQSERKAGWLVDATNKILTITAGSAATSADDADIDVIFIGVAT